MGQSSRKCEPEISKARLDGKTAVVTGANSGIGKEVVKDFFKRGARVIMACRNLDKAKAAVEDIKKQCEGCENLGQLQIVQLDLASLDSVRRCAQSILKSEKRVDLLINNGGVMASPEGKTEDGFETQFGSNHLGHFLFTILLLPKICQSTPARIVTVSSKLHTRGHIDFDDLNWEKRSYSPLEAYYQSKLANILFTKELAKRLEGASIKGVTTYSIHPGVVATDLSQNIDTALFPGAQWLWQKSATLKIIKTPEQGAQTTIYCAVDEKCANETGLHYSDCAVAEVSRNAKNMKDAERLWNESWKLVGLDENYNPFQ